MSGEQVVQGLNYNLQTVHLLSINGCTAECLSPPRKYRREEQDRFITAFLENARIGRHRHHAVNEISLWASHWKMGSRVYHIPVMTSSRVEKKTSEE